MTDPSIFSVIRVRSGIGSFPVAGGVALCTIGSKCTAMEGRLRVTRDTVGWCAFENAVHMARAATHIDMSARQFEC
jgi:hypothetical protein